jgi:hypothetical protein
MSNIKQFPVSEREAVDGLCKDIDGCPSEKAVLQRFWRSHNGKSPEDYAMSATSPAPAVVQMTGKIIEVGDMDEGRGFALDVGNGEYITVTRLTEDQTRAVAPLYDQEVVLSLSASGVQHG